MFPEPLNHLTDAEISAVERWAKDGFRGNLDQYAAAKRTLSLIAETRLARRLVHGLYKHIPDVRGQEELQAELERYAGHIGVINPAF